MAFSPPRPAAISILQVDHPLDGQPCAAGNRGINRHFLGHEEQAVEEVVSHGALNDERDANSFSIEASDESFSAVDDLVAADDSILPVTDE
ncbi:MAG: hypothetical protein ACOVOA_14220 [Allorhizobium sp.]